MTKEIERDRADEPEANQLRRLLFAKTKALEHETISSDGVVPHERLEILRRLSSLVEISEGQRRKPPVARWPLIMAFAFTLAIASILLFLRPKSTTVEMDLRVNEVSFVLSSRQVLSEQLRLSALGVSGLRKIQMPRARGSNESALVSGRDFNSSASIAVGREQQSEGQLSLPELILLPQTRVSLTKTESPGQYRVALQGQGLELNANVSGPIRLGLAGGDERLLSFLSPKAIVFEPQAQQINLDLTFVALPQKISPAPLDVQELSLLRVENRRGPEGLPVRELSTVLSGSIYLEELNGEEHKLRSGEAIRMKATSGQVDVLELSDEQIHLRFHGDVEGMTAGASNVGRSLMPTWLEWLKARRGLFLLWGTAIYLYGLIGGVMRWIKAAP